MKSPGTEVVPLAAKVSTCPLRDGKVVTLQALYTIIHWGYIQWLLERQYRNGMFKRCYEVTELEALSQPDRCSERLLEQCVRQGSSGR